jgi:hypothetical protein
MVNYLTGISPHPLPWTRKRRNLVLAKKVMLIQISVKPSHSDIQVVWIFTGHSPRN